jgi:hypothetical protein
MSATRSAALIAALYLGLFFVILALDPPGDVKTSGIMPFLLTMPAGLAVPHVLESVGIGSTFLARLLVGAALNAAGLFALLWLLDQVTSGRRSTRKTDAHAPSSR